MKGTLICLVQLVMFLIACPSLMAELGFTFLQDNDAVIKMIIKERTSQMRHVARPHQVDLDQLFERHNRDPNAYLKFVGTKEQLADIIKKILAQERHGLLCANFV